MISIRIYKEKAGIISEDPVWVCLHDCYMYTADTFIKLVCVVVLEWKLDKHLIG